MTTIWVTWQQEGFHKWPQATFRPYLAKDHRHLFHFVFEIEVFTDDRQIEFHSLLDLCKTTLWMSYERRSAFELDFKSASCEHIAKFLVLDVLNTLAEKGINIKRYCSCGVSEDNECGAHYEQGGAHETEVTKLES